MSSIGGTFPPLGSDQAYPPEGKGITGLKILLLRIAVSKINPAQVFETGRTIYGLDDSVPGQIISHKNGDGITQYADLQELFINSTGVLTQAGNGLKLNISDPTLVELGGSLNRFTEIGLNTQTLLLSDTIGGLLSTYYFSGAGSIQQIQNTGISSGNFSLSDTAFNVSVVDIAGGNNQAQFALDGTQALMNYTRGSDGHYAGFQIGSSASVFYDTLRTKGLVYGANFATAGTLDPRWIPDYGAVTDAINSTTIYFAPGTLVGRGPTFSDDPGTVNNPFAPNATNGLSVSTGSGIVLGGPLTGNTTITNSGFDMIWNQASGSFIQRYQFGGVDKGYITADGYYRGSGIYSPSGLASGFLTFLSGGTVIGRNQADAVAALKVQQSNLSATGDILQIQNAYTSILTVDAGSGLTHSPARIASAGSGIAHNITGFLRPTANGDTQIGLKVAPTFGSNNITAWSTVVGGSGYTNGTYLVLLSGGTGIGAVAQITVSGGAITGTPTIAEPGVNYTVGDVLSIIASPGSGASVTVSAISSDFLGLTNISAQFSNAPIVLDQITTPTNLINGMMWYEGTNVFFRTAGVTKQFTLV